MAEGAITGGAKGETDAHTVASAVNDEAAQHMRISKVPLISRLRSRTHGTPPHEHSRGLLLAGQCAVHFFEIQKL